MTGTRLEWEVGKKVEKSIEGKTGEEGEEGKGRSEQVKVPRSVGERVCVVEGRVGVEWSGVVEWR